MIQMNNRVGEEFVSNEGSKFVIVDYKNSKNVLIEFQDEYKVRKTVRYTNCIEGKVKNPYYSSIHGVACLGLMSDGNKPKVSENGKPTRAYSTWYNMIERCYISEKQPTYKDCKVCDRWLVFANFLEDLPKIENYELWVNGGYALDKDIKQQGVDNKVYSLDTVCFVTQSDNNKEMNSRRWS